jgi:hypothetical protein
MAEVELDTLITDAQPFYLILVCILHMLTLCYDAAF